MEDQDKTKAELISELVALREHVDEKNKLQTELGDLEESLKVSEEKYRILYEKAPLSYQSLDIDGCFIDINPAWLRTLGYNREEVIGKKYADFLHPNWKPHFENNFPEFKRIGYVHDVQFKIKHKDGHYLDISFEGCIGYYPDGKVKQTYCVFQDITERKLAEQEVITQKYYLTKAQEIGKIGSWELDIKNNSLKWTDESYKIFGVPIGTEMSFDIFINLVHPDDRNYLIEKWNDGLDKNGYDIEHRILVDQRVKWLREKAVFKFDAEDNPISAIGIVQDITTKKKIEQELKESKLKYKLLAEYTYDWEYWIDPAGKYLYISPSVERITGYTTYDFYQNPENLFTMIREDYRDEISKHYKDENNIDEPIFKTTFPIISKEGKEVWISHTCSPVFDDSGTWIGRRGNNRDVTSRIIAEKKLRKSEYLLNETQKISKIGGWEYRVADEKTIWTDEVFNIFGLPKGEVLSHEERMKFYHKDDILPITRAFEKCVDEGVEYSLELRFINANNKKMWVSITGKPVYENNKLKKVVGNIIDITEKKELELLLENEKASAQTYLDIAGSILVALDKNGSIILLNKKGYETLGYKGENLLGSNWFNLVIPENVRPDVKGVFEKMMIGEIENVEYFENQVVTKSGELRDIAWHNTNLVDDEASIVSLLSAGEDITNRKKAEKDFSNIFQYLKAAEGIAELGYYENNLTTGEIYWSEGMIKLLGYKPNEIETNTESFMDLIHPDDKDAEIEKIQNAIKSENKFNSEFRIIKRNGDIGWLYTIGETGRNEQSELINKGILQDITERKKIAVDLEENEKKYRQLFELAQEGIWVIDEDSKTTLANTSMADILGYSIDEMIGKPIFNFMDETGIAIAEENVKRRKEGIKEQHDFEFIKKDGTRIIASMETAPIKDKDGNYEGAIAGVIDITKRKQMEEDLIKSEAQFKSIFFEAPLGIEYYDSKGKLINVNKECLNIFGVSDIKEIQGFKLFEDPNLSDESKKQVKEGKPFQYETEFDFELVKKNNLYQTSKSGTSYLNILITPYKVASENENGYLVHIEDITNRKQMERELKKSEDRLSKIIFAANDGTWDWNLISNEVYFDPRYYQMAGYDVDEFPHKLEEFQKRIHPDDTEYVMGEAQKHLEGKLEHFSVEFRFLKKDNSWIWILGRGSIVERDEQGRPLRFVGTHTGITDRKKVEKNLKESEEKFSKSFYNHPTPMMILNLETGERIDVNNSYVKLLGYTGDQIIEGNLYTNNFAHDQNKLKEIVNKIKTNGTVSSEYFQCVNKSGKIISLLISASRLSFGDGNNIIAAYLDITESEKAQKELKERNNELEIFNDITVDREFRMIELKKEINELMERTGEKPKYEIPV